MRLVRGQVACNVSRQHRSASCVRRIQHRLHNVPVRVPLWQTVRIQPIHFVLVHDQVLFDTVTVTALACSCACAGDNRHVQLLPLHSVFMLLGGSPAVAAWQNGPISSGVGDLHVRVRAVERLRLVSLPTALLDLSPLFVFLQAKEPLL